MDKEKGPRKGNSPSFRLVEGRSVRRGEEERALGRLGPMAAFGMAAVSLLTLALSLMEHFSLIPVPLHYGGGLLAFGLRSVLIYGIIPLLTASLMAAIFRPDARSIPGVRPGLPLLFASPVTGFLSGWLVWTATTLITSLVPWTLPWLRIPDFWQTGTLYLWRTPLSTLVVLGAAVLLPAASQELLFRGMIQPSYASAESSLIRILPLALIAALTSLDLPGGLVFFLAALMASRLRLASGSLMASSLYTAAFSLSMLLARQLFDGISQVIFRIPLIDSFRNRLFLAALSMILIVLLLAPMAVINAAAVRQKDPVKAGNKKTDGLLRPANRALAWVCTAVLAACLYFLN